jgi:hypothetical protein
MTTNPRNGNAVWGDGASEGHKKENYSGDSTKAFLTLQAVFALKGYTLNRKGSGYIVCETATGDCFELSTLVDVQLFALVGVQS